MGQALRELGRVCPALEDSVLRPELLHAVYKLSLNGERFVSDPETPLADGRRAAAALGRRGRLIGCRRAISVATFESIPGPAGLRCVPLEDAVLRGFLGGVGLGAWILAHETQAGVDPLGPEAALVFALSPLVGSPLTTSAKFAVVAFSPLTGRVCDALSSSHFAIAAKRAGVDALAVTGACDVPSVVFIDGTNRASRRSAGDRPARSGGCPRGTPRMRSGPGMGLTGKLRRSGRPASG